MGLGLPAPGHWRERAIVHSPASLGARRTEPGTGAAARLLGILALLLPARDRERVVGEVLANMAELRWRQRVVELLSVAGAAPGIAVILRWARRRRA